MRMELQALKKNLMQQGILKETEESQDKKFIKIIQCLQCRNTIRPNDLHSPSDEKSLNHNESEKNANNSTAEKERIKRIPQALVHETVTNDTKVLNGHRITSIVRNTTIVEKEEAPGILFFNDVLPNSIILNTVKKTYYKMFK